MFHTSWFFSYHFTGVFLSHCGRLNSDTIELFSYRPLFFPLFSDNLDRYGLSKYSFEESLGVVSLEFPHCPSGFPFTM